MPQNKLLGYLTLFFLIGGAAVALESGNCWGFLPPLVILLFLGRFINRIQGSGGGGGGRGRGRRGR